MLRIVAPGSCQFACAGHPAQRLPCGVAHLIVEHRLDEGRQLSGRVDRVDDPAPAEHLVGGEHVVITDDGHGRLDRCVGVELWAALPVEHQVAGVVAEQLRFAVLVVPDEPLAVRRANRIVAQDRLTGEARRAQRLVGDRLGPLGGATHGDAVVHRREAAVAELLAADRDRRGHRRHTGRPGGAGAELHVDLDALIGPRGHGRSDGVGEGAFADLGLFAGLTAPGDDGGGRGVRGGLGGTGRRGGGGRVGRCACVAWGGGRCDGLGLGGCRGLGEGVEVGDHGGTLGHINPTGDDLRGLPDRFDVREPLGGHGLTALGGVERHEQTVEVAEAGRLVTDRGGDRLGLGVEDTPGRRRAPRRRSAPRLRRA
jgi:hypothetical protein